MKAIAILAILASVALATPLAGIHKRNDDDCPSISCHLEGEPCGESLDGDQLVSCIAPFLCISDGKTAKCQRHIPLGEKCFESWECNDNQLNAVAAYCSDKGICTPSKLAGQPCTDAEDACLEPLVCDSGVCRNPFTKKLNESCDDDCIETLQCVAGACMAFSQLGEPCGDPEDGFAQCDWDFTCVNSVCVDLGTVQDGAACEMTLSCTKGLVCNIDGFCQAPSTNTSEAECDSDDDCDGQSTCGCDFEQGLSVCFPLATWTDDMMQKYQNYANCMKKNGNDGYKCGPELTLWAASDPDEVIVDEELWCMV